MSFVIFAWGGHSIAQPEGAEPGFRVIVAATSAITEVDRSELARIFLKKQTRWKTGEQVAPVDQSARSPVRAAFSHDVLVVEGLEKISAVENYWRGLIYSGRGTPPAVKTSDDEVRLFVAATPGAIGYVSAKADLNGVKAVKVEN
ncbi:MAG TPA: hypothetical protein VFQ51_01410 [Vicinamibacteria bacterium]|nr:hypothetical protein [Vicinamibacteria bacterium]